MFPKWIKMYNLQSIIFSNLIDVEEVSLAKVMFSHFKACDLFLPFLKSGM